LILINSIRVTIMEQFRKDKTLSTLQVSSIQMTALTLEKNWDWSNNTSSAQLLFMIWLEGISWSTMTGLVFFLKKTECN
jgi:hypothetical protein